MLDRRYRLPLHRPPSPPLFSHATPYFTAKVFRNTLPHARFGFIVSKKVSPQATGRNRVKRQLRSVVEELLPKIAPGYDILFIVQKRAIEAERADMQQSLIQFLTTKALIV